ncbi:polysaccharide pyruvyl transferase family protein [Crocosphaera sp. UHCC 0190]|uniref:polysaccharide pyruvyl transferase family protein n=1 Tax=Crocosphaera sp. UHCC 0190 TaxID=3110246 RepID=UPI002B209ACF|nr:polysaccharide pyruvyl transferase family protein [Crocosphaera sp. UHCC 0190]MEA5509371.1 polysaccharide pyruvyl transferase family protein [Crocosphaera sp. UHCC 0190]
MKVVITGITGMRNRGVEAIIVPTIQELRKRQPDININLLTRSPDYDQIRLESYDVKLHLESQHLGTQTPPQSRKKVLLSKIFPGYKLPKIQPIPTSPLIRKADAIIASGGDIFSPEYPIAPHLKPLKLALDVGTPVMFLAQSISPYKKDEDAEEWLEVARHAKLITVREQLTYNYLTKDLGLSTELVKLTADPAFLLSPAPQEQINNLLKGYGISGERPLVALGTSQGICSYTSSGLDYEKHITSWQKVIEMIINELGAEVILIPHVQEIRAGNDDRILATKLLRALDYSPRVHLAGCDHTASEFKGLIAQCELVISERTHAAIAGLSSGVCTVAVGYSIKSKGISAELIGEDKFEEGLLISVQDFLNPELACQAVRNSWKQRDEIKTRIKERLPEIKERASKNFDLLIS